tara:strand:+ start:3906 stop:4913 length:1008 start_codon:yes stop_codon:yes gene_type:complete
MTPLKNCINKKSTKSNPIWLMRQAGRYLPEFRKIRKINSNFIKLCLNANICPKITLQPLNRFDLDAAIIFSDILMVPYGLQQSVKFKKNFGPQLGNLDLDNMETLYPNVFRKKLSPIYKSIKEVKNNILVKNKKDLIGFVGAPWTLLVYMINRVSPKKKLNKNFFKDKLLLKRLLNLLNKFLQIHIKEQIRNGATVIQIFDSWAGLIEKKDLDEFIYKPTLKLVNYTKSLNTPVICFPRNIKNYKNYCEIIKPDVINIDYNVDPVSIKKKIHIPIQGGLDPKILLTDKPSLKKETTRYLDIFKDHPYIFNLGHGVLPETEPSMVEYLINIVKDYK